jgi:hypothetical protein
MLFMLGLILTAVGVAVTFAVRALSFARYMHLEDLGLDVDPAVGPELFTLLVAPTLAERMFFWRNSRVFSSRPLSFDICE